MQTKRLPSKAGAVFFMLLLIIISSCSSGRRVTTVNEDSATTTIAESERSSSDIELKQIPSRLSFSPVILPEQSNTPEPNQDIAYELKIPGHVRITMYNFLGNQLCILTDTKQEPGVYTLSWDGKDAAQNPLPNSIYFYQISILNDTGDELFSEA
ncbi:MAG: hypothetical protein AAFP70_04585, partial [Calditrichota bacterium]